MRRRIFASFLCLSLIFGLFSPMQAAATDYALSELGATSTFTINGETVGDNTVIQNGDEFALTLEYTISDTATYTAEDIFTYDIPDVLNVNATSGEIMNSLGDRVNATWTIENGVLKIQHKGDFLEENSKMVRLTLRGTITVDSSTTGDTITIELPDKQIIVKRTTDDGLQIAKSAVKRVSGGQIYIDYTVIVTALTDQTNVEITDTPDDDLTIDESSIVATTTGSGTVTKGDGMTWTCNTLNANETVTITYTVKAPSGLSESAVGTNPSPQAVDRTYNNTASAKSTLNSTVQATAPVTTYPLTIFKSGFLDSGNTASWTVTVYPGELDTITLKDSLTSTNNVTGLPTGSEVVTVQKYNADGSTSGSAVQIAFSELQNGYRIDREAENDGSYYVLTFTTPAITSGITVRNLITETNTGAWADANVSLAGTGIDIEKECLEVDAESGKIKWKITFVSGENTTMSRITDIIGYQSGWSAYYQGNLNAGHKVISDSTENYGVVSFTKTINGETTAVDYTAASGGDNGQRSALYIDMEDTSLEAGAIYEIVLWTEYDLNANTLSETVENYVSILNGRYSARATANLTINYITKTLSAQKANWQEWTIKTADLDEGGGTITDTIPTGLDLVSVTLDGTTLSSSAYSYDSTTGELEVSVSSGSHELVIRTELNETDYQLLEADVTYTNKAYITTADGTKWPEISANATVTPRVILEKDLIYDASTAPYVNYTIKVNASEDDLVEGSDTITVRDTMGSALKLVENTLTVTDKAGNDVAYTSTLENTVLTIEGLADETAYIITYQARVIMDPGYELEGLAENKVEIVGVTGGEVTTEITGKVLEYDAWSYSEACTVQIYKQNSDGSPLEGATFAVYTYGTGTEPSEMGTLVDTITLTSGEKGFTDTFSMTYGVIYGIVETSAPEGYRLDSTVHYIVRPSNNSSLDYDSSVTVYDGYNAITYSITNEAVTSVSVTKVWEDGDNRDDARPESITVNLLADGAVTEKTLTLSEDNSWSGSFTDLDITDSDGDTIVYTVEEVAVDGYVSTITGDAETGFTITNLKAYSLPETGGTGTIWYTAAGTLLTGGAALLLYRKRRVKGGRR